MKEVICQKAETIFTRVMKTITKYNLIEKGDRLVLGVSGGPDSICMLSILNKIRENDLDFEMSVAHINHLIRKEAKEDEIYVKEFCEKLKIPFYSKSIDVQKMANNNKIGTEEAGRNARYTFFNEILEKTNSNKIAIAHNKNDKIETMIMNILRGSGISGLKGIEVCSKIKNDSKCNIKYIRPLIECERTEIEKYCEDNNINARIDKTNFENIYTRNKVRNVIIPYIKEEFNPNIIQTMDRLSGIVKEEEDYFFRLVERKYKEFVIEENEKQIIINLKKFNQEERVIKSRLLLYTISRLLGTSKGIEKVHIDDVIKLIENNIGNKYLTPNKNIKVLLKNHKIYFLNLKVD